MATFFPPRPRRAGAALALGLLVLVLHLGLAGLWPARPGLADSPRPALQLRSLSAPAPVATVEGSVPPAARAAAPTPAPRAAPAAPRQAADEAPGRVAESAPAPAPAAAEAAEAADTTEAALQAAAPPAGTPLPTYATRLPPPVTLQFAVRREGAEAPLAAAPRGGLQAQLRWQHAAGSYTLTMGMGAVGWASVGGFIAQGLAPERHVETRRGRELRAANFQRPGMEGVEGPGRITFSGPRFAHPLWPGVQDRLSWLVQLPAVLAAEPALAQPGREVLMMVAGVRGDALPWRFEAVALEDLDLPAGLVRGALHLRREPLRAWDSRIDVWLDPARHFLPVRLRMRQGPNAPLTEFELLAWTLQP
ncbi:DUF3108 domain-containing protein [Rubrivivax rivuli]|uniref:DUF3108 domain-containing protein n=1 Tax=Rubrivivax rivuli TaxID=1862385 RepID=A0A437RSA9_9BURK|nr:DUF3108 domain-containing protein [Rubrivivax rivuli]RVU49645.1 DUF3108 domain-containing protein [Rubrivivax rivuli]